MFYDLTTNDSLLVKVHEFAEMLPGFEKTGYVSLNFDTAIDMIDKIEDRGERIEILRRAGSLAHLLGAGGR